MTEDRAKSREEIESYLAKIRKTIADSESLVSKAELRIAETDRMLEQQGLTRAQVMSMRFTDSQLEEANAELERRGLKPFDAGEWATDRETSDASLDAGLAPQDPDGGDDLEHRRQKFGMMMKPFQI